MDDNKHHLFHHKKGDKDVITKEAHIHKEMIEKPLREIVVTEKAIGEIGNEKTYRFNAPKDSEFNIKIAKSEDFDF